MSHAGGHGDNPSVWIGEISRKWNEQPLVMEVKCE